VCTPYSPVNVFLNFHVFAGGGRAKGYPLRKLLVDFHQFL
jgi:hypothetical protein